MAFFATASGLMMDRVRSTAMIPGSDRIKANKFKIVPREGRAAERVSGRKKGGRRPRSSAAAGQGARRLPGDAAARSAGGYIMPSVRGSQMESGAQYVTITRKTSIVASHGHTATVSSVMPIFVIPEATYRLSPTGGWHMPTSM